MQAVRILLHGGPWHGKTIAVPAGQQRIEVVGYPDKIDPDRFRQEPTEHPEPVGTKHGSYSRVFGHADDYEWDGWRPTK